MNTMRFCARMACVCTLLLLSVTLAAAQEVEVKLDGVSFQQVLDRLFGTTANPGLLAGKERFELRATDVTLTAAQEQNFFVPTAANSSDFANLITAAEQIRGSEVKIRGLVDGKPFDIKLEGKEVKVEGLNLTQAQLDSLVNQLKGISGLREAKIETLVDGKPMVLKIENRAGIVKVVDLPRHNDHERHASNDNRGQGFGNNGQSARADLTERPQKVDRLEKIDKVEKIDRIERPDTEHGGSGRH
jgi:hypothetical protein